MKEGWKCPVCNSVYAPFVRECEKCNKKTDGLCLSHAHNKQEGFLTEQQIIDQCEGENPFDDLDEYFGGNES